MGFNYYLKKIRAKRITGELKMKNLEIIGFNKDQTEEIMEVINNEVMAAQTERVDIYLSHNNEISGNGKSKVHAWVKYKNSETGELFEVWGCGNKMWRAYSMDMKITDKAITCKTCLKNIPEEEV